MARCPPTRITFSMPRTPTRVRLTSVRGLEACTSRAASPVVSVIKNPCRGTGTPGQTAKGTDTKPPLPRKPSPYTSPRSDPGNEQSWGPRRSKKRYEPITGGPAADGRADEPSVGEAGDYPNDP